MLYKALGSARVLGGGMTPGRMGKVLAVLTCLVGPGIAHAWNETFPGGSPSQTWAWYQQNPDGSAAPTSPTYASGSVSVESTTPTFPEGGPIAYFGFVPTPFAGSQVVSSTIISTAAATMPQRDVGVLGMLDPATLNAYAMTIDYNGQTIDLSKIAGGSPTNLLPTLAVPGFDQGASYRVELEQYGQSITGRIFDSNNVNLRSISAVDLAPYTAGVGGLAVSRPTDLDVVRATWGASSASAPATAQFWAGDGSFLGGSGTFSTSGATFLTDGSGSAGVWNSANPAVFTADSVFFQNRDRNEPNFYEAYRVPTPQFIANVPTDGVPVSNAVKFYSNQYSIRWEDNGDPTYANFTGGNGLILTGNPEFYVAPDVIGTVSARLTGSGGFRKTGPGILNLSNMFSNFTGTVTIDEGTVYVGVNGYENSGVTNALGAASGSRQVVVNAGGVLSFRTVEGMSEGNSRHPTDALATQKLVANGGLITNNIMIEQNFQDNPLDNWHYMGAYTAVGDVELNNGEMLGQATFWNDLWTYQTPQEVTRNTWPGFQAFFLQGTVTSSGDSRIAMRASQEFQDEWNRVSENGTGGDGLYTYNDSTGFHLNWSGGTNFNVTDGTLTVSANLLDSPSGGSDETPDDGAGGYVGRDGIRAGLTKTGAGTMVLSGDNWMTGTVTVSAGTLRAENPGGNQPLRWTPTVVTGSGAVLQLGAPAGPLDANELILPSLSVESNGTAVLPSVVGSTGRLTLSTDSLSVVQATGGKLDLGVSELAVATGGISAAELRADLIAGRGTGSWNGAAGITSSDAASSGGTRAVGYVVNPDGSSKVAFASPGDLNLNGSVDAFDLIGINSAATYGTGAASVWSTGDFNYDGVTTVLDLVAIASAGTFGQGNYLPTQSVGSISAVPEPTSWLLLAGAAVAVAAAGRWRRA
jgi:autotransporter-associated beta strand protein